MRSDASHFEKVTPDNFKQFFENFFATTDRLSGVVLPEQAMQDPLAVEQAGSADHEISDLYPERVFSSHVLFQTLRHLLPAFQTPTVDARQTGRQITDATISQLYPLADWGGLWSLFEAAIMTMPDGIQLYNYLQAMKKFFTREWLDLLTQEEKIRHDELYKVLFKDNKILFPPNWEVLSEEFHTIESKISSARKASENEMKQAQREYETFMISKSEKEYKRKFSSQQEIKCYEYALRLRKYLPALSVLSPREVREELARRSQTDAFCYVLAEDIAEYERTATEAPSLDIFNNMVKDFISRSPSGLWPFIGKENFSLGITSLPRAESELGQTSIFKQCADAVIDALEELLDDLQAVFSNTDSKNLSQKQVSLQRSVVVHCDQQLIKEFLAPDGHFSHRKIGYLEDSPLVKEIRARWEKFSDPGSWGDDFDMPSDMLIRISMMPFLIRQGIYEGENIPEQIHQSAQCVSRYHYYKLLPTARAAIDDKIQYLLKPFKEIVSNLINQRTEASTFHSVLALGFSGPIFNQVLFSREKKNIVSLAFSKAARTEWHDFLLQLLYWRLTESHTIFATHSIKIKPISNLGDFIHKKERRENDFILDNFDQPIYSYLLKLILELLLVRQDVEIHHDLKKAWIENIKQLIGDSKEIKSEKGRLSKLLNDDKPIEKSDFEKIRRIVLDEQHYGCAEAILSKYAHTNKFIPIMFLPKTKEQVHIDGRPVFAGSSSHQRSIISPCRCCRLLSAPYLLWAVHYKGWGLGDLNVAATNFSQPLIRPRLPERNWTQLGLFGLSAEQVGLGTGLGNLPLGDSNNNNNNSDVSSDARLRQSPGQKPYGK